MHICPVPHGVKFCIALQLCWILLNFVETQAASIAVCRGRPGADRWLRRWGGYEAHLQAADCRQEHMAVWRHGRWLAAVASGLPRRWTGRIWCQQWQRGRQGVVNWKVYFLLNFCMCTLAGENDSVPLWFLFLSDFQTVYTRVILVVFSCCKLQIWQDTLA